MNLHICPKYKKCDFHDYELCEHKFPHIPFNNCKKVECNGEVCKVYLEPKVNGIDEIEDIENENNMRRCN